MDAVYKSSPIKRRPRRTRAKINAVKAAILATVERYKPMTVRQVFYQLVTQGVIEKDEREYKSTVCRLLGDMRRDKEIPFTWIADNTRYQRRPTTYTGLEQMLEITRQTYRRDLWVNQDVYLEIWCEKEALAGVLFDVTGDFDVPLMITRGYPSLSFLHGAATYMAAQDKPVCVRYFGDNDPSGKDISRHVEAEVGKLYRELGGEHFDFKEVAVSAEQVAAMNLPTRPTKKSDSRSKKFHGESTEVDAIDPDTLRKMCRDCIVEHIDGPRYRSTLRIEEEERLTLQAVMESLES